MLDIDFNQILGHIPEDFFRLDQFEAAGFE